MYALLVPHWHGRTGALPEQVRRLEEEIGRTLPTDYHAFLLWSNGGEGRLGRVYFMLWETAVIAELNKAYRIDHYMPGVVAIGTDGGSQCYALDYRGEASNPALVRCDLGDLDPAAITVMGRTFRESLERALKS